ncbi:PQQ-binding-like beta-propeller repeat protein [Natrialbaceae archaeon AArc-T1-2]|uniref:PQQ-binding-like beta-propeller repeat protein n=1 Tax=Natrialbaceae archaeon AArc-T1-2 TaxID=3053904 RepID=UPI00255AE85C|nr:PQQ-binding-like beta-propeller repeat protein [Natrialbaceae archaeon AArc-T1-2]WIV67716.1 PQQ-binding-like beta-propeller repeat protein [Natrialbaceae archaeon AArc-T1-2]
MPSRRWLLAGAGSVLTALVGGHAVAGRTRSDGDSVHWPMARYDAAGTGHSPDASGPKDAVRVAWERELDTSFSGAVSPILFEGTLYAVGGPVVALEAETGELEFTHDGPYRSSPAPAATDVYRTDTLAISSPAGVVGLNAGGGYRIPLLGGRVGVDRWHGPGEDPDRSPLGPPDAPPPVAVDDAIYAAVPGTNDLVALEATDGTERFRVSHGAGSGNWRPAVRNDTVYAVGYARELGAYDAETGENHWTVEIDDLTPHAPTVTDEVVVVPGRESVTAVEVDDGSVRWEYDHDGNVSPPDRSDAAVADGRVFVADGTGSLHAIDLESGEERWTASVGGQASPVVADGVVYLTRRTVSVYAFDAETGEERWEYDLERPTSAPAVGDGRLYLVGSRRIVALEEGDR